MWLASEESSYITGAVLAVEGEFTLQCNRQIVTDNLRGYIMGVLEGKVSIITGSANGLGATELFAGKWC